MCSRLKIYDSLNPNIFVAYMDANLSLFYPGLIGMTFAPVYCASKHGVVGFSRSLRELAQSDGIRVNCICPEFADTAIVNDSMIGMNEETKALVKSIGLLT